MKIRSILAGVLCIISAATFAQTSTAVVYKYTQIDYPGAASTVANGINNNNLIVGTYVDSSGLYHGFSYSNGSFAPINFPKAAQTVALGVNDNGDVVGWYTVSAASGATPHGYVRRNGVFTIINYPNSTAGTTATGINNAGTIVGNFGSSQGYVYQNGTFTVLNAPQQPGESNVTVLNGISNLGIVVGQVFSGGAWRSFWVPTNRSDFDFLQPLHALDTALYGVNSRGDVVGCENSSESFIVFSPEAGEGIESSEHFPSIVSLPNPLDQYSCARSINHARLIVDDIALSNHGFLGIPVLTLDVSSPPNHSTSTNPVHVAAIASGSNPISQIQVLVNNKLIYKVAGNTLNANINLPIGSNEQLVVQAVDSKGVVARVVKTITVK